MKTDLFDRYMREVGRRLPKRQRADVETELHSLLMDALQDRVPEGEAGDAASEEDQVAVLEEFGPPAEMAAQYTPPRHYVIGPRLYVIYWIVVAAVAGSLALAHAIMLLLALWGDPEPLSELGPTLGRIAGSYVSAALAGVGSITLTFVVLERVLPESAIEDLNAEQEWDPRDLPQIEDRGRIELGSVIAEIVLTVIALIVFNVFPEWVGVNFRGSINDAPARWYSFPLLAPAFFALYLPLLNVQWVLRIALDVVLLRQGHWQRLTRLIDLVLTLFGGYILYRMIFGPPFLTMEAISSESLRRTLESILFPLLRLALGIGLVATIVEVVQKLIRVFRGETSLVYGRMANKPADR